MKTEDDLCEVSITAPDKIWLEELCRDVLTRRLAASAHIVHPVSSVYRWQGAIEEATEARAFLRTRCSLVESLVAHVVDRHPYEVPHITVLPIIDGNPEYLAWVRDESGELRRESGQ